MKPTYMLRPHRQKSQTDNGINKRRDMHGFDIITSDLELKTVLILVHKTHCVDPKRLDQISGVHRATVHSKIILAKALGYIDGNDLTPEVASFITELDQLIRADVKDRLLLHTLGYSNSALQLDDLTALQKEKKRNK